jgi:hypothetical protein
MKTTLLTLCACAAVLAGIARADSPAAPGPNPAGAARVTFAVAVDHMRYPAAAGGAPATIHGVATLTNTGDQTLRYMYSARTVDWQITDPSGSVLYDPAVGRMLPMFVMIRTLDPGKSASFKADVPLTHQDGTPLDAGSYDLRVHFRGDLDLTAMAAFRIGG